MAKRIDLEKVKKIYNWRSSTIGDNVIYTTLVFNDGTASCNCPGWAFKKKGQERTCKHTKMALGQKRMDRSLFITDLSPARLPHKGHVEEDTIYTECKRLIEV